MTIPGIALPLIVPRNTRVSPGLGGWNFIHRLNKNNVNLWYFKVFFSDNYSPEGIADCPKRPGNKQTLYYYLLFNFFTNFTCFSHRVNTERSYSLFLVCQEWHKESRQRTRLLRSRSAHTLTPSGRGRNQKPRWHENNRSAFPPRFPPPRDTRVVPRDPPRLYPYRGTFSAILCGVVPPPSAVFVNTGTTVSSMSRM